MGYTFKALAIIFGLPLLINAQIQIGPDINGGVAGDQFGKQVKVAANGNILGVLSNDSNGNVHIYENVGSNWELYGTDSEGGHFDGVTASDLDFSDDGNTLAIRIGGESKVYTYDSGVWTQKGSNVSMTPAQSTYGTGVCLSSNGDIIAMGATNYVPSSSTGRYLPPPNYHGLVQIFKFESGNWNKIGNDIVGNAFDRSAESYSLSSDGNTIAISNYFSARIYENISGVWTLKGNEIQGTENDQKWVSLSSDGNIVAFGDPSYSVGYIQRGLVQIYQYISNDWVQIGSNILGSVAYEFVGKNISLSADGTIVAISLNGNETNGDNSGQVRIYKNSSGTWTQIGSNINGEASGDYFGFSLNLSTDASTVAIGTPFNDANGADSGHVKVYALGSVLASNDSDLSQFSLFPNPTTNEFTIRLPQGQELQKATIYNNLGQLIYSTREKVIETNFLSPGIYVVEIETNKGRSSKKLVKI